jgi:hypothetical protein
MGILGCVLAAMGAIFVGLIGAWLRSEISAHFEPLINYLVQKGSARMPEQERLHTQAEVLALVNAIRSPSKKLKQALSFYLEADRSRHAFSSYDRTAGVKSPTYLLYLNMVLMVAVTLGMLSELSVILSEGVMTTYDLWKMAFFLAVSVHPLVSSIRVVSNIRDMDEIDLSGSTSDNSTNLDTKSFKEIEESFALQSAERSYVEKIARMTAKFPKLAILQKMIDRRHRDDVK